MCGGKWGEGGEKLQTLLLIFTLTFPLQGRKKKSKHLCLHTTEFLISFSTLLCVVVFGYNDLNSRTLSRVIPIFFVTTRYFNIGKMGNGSLCWSAELKMQSSLVLILLQLSPFHPVTLEFPLDFLFSSSLRDTLNSLPFCCVRVWPDWCFITYVHGVRVRGRTPLFECDKRGRGEARQWESDQ